MEKEEEEVDEDSVKSHASSITRMPESFMGEVWILLLPLFWKIGVV